MGQKDDGYEEPTQTAEAADDSYVLKLDEIGSLAQEAGKPAETLMDVVALIARRRKNHFVGTNQTPTMAPEQQTPPVSALGRIDKS